MKSEMKTTITFSLMVILIAAVITPGLQDAYADVLSPKKQIQFGIDSDEIFCKGKMFKVFKATNNDAICVNPDSAKKLLDKGFIKSYDAKKLSQLTEALTKKSQNQSITKEAVLKQTVQPNKATSMLAVDAYHVVFKACAGKAAIIVPEVAISSESETRFVKLTTQIPANQCQTNAAKIKATNPDSITLEIINQGIVSGKIASLQDKVDDLKEQLQAEKDAMKARQAETPEGEEFVPNPTRVSKIAEIRKELNSAKEELNRYLYALNVTPKITTKEIQAINSFKGTPIEDNTVNLLSAEESPAKPGTFDVAFEMCAADEPIRVPMVTVSSDTETKDVRLGDKIRANNCQVTGAKITATSADDIGVSISEKLSDSVAITNLENRLAQLADNMQAQNDRLQEITHANPRPADFKEQAAEIANNISDLRSQILTAKAQLYNALNQIDN